MGKMNYPRILLGGVLAAVIMFIVEAVTSFLYIEDMQAALAAHNLSYEMSTSGMAVGILYSLIVGVLMVWFYAAVRPRFGPGPKTAVLVAVALWVGGYLLSLIGYQVLGLFPGCMLVLWGGIGLVEMIVANLAGASIYRED